MFRRFLDAQIIKQWLKSVKIVKTLNQEAISIGLIFLTGSASSISFLKFIISQISFEASINDRIIDSLPPKNLTRPKILILPQKPTLKFIKNIRRAEVIWTLRTLKFQILPNWDKLERYFGFQCTKIHSREYSFLYSF